MVTNSLLLEAQTWPLTDYFELIPGYLYGSLVLTQPLGFLSVLLLTISSERPISIECVEIILPRGR